VNLISLLERSGHSIRVLDDESTGRQSDLDGFDVEFLEGSVTDAKVVSRAVEGMDAVVHLAADTRVMDSIENPVKNFQSNVVGSFTLLQAMRETSVKRIVAASTGGAILGEVPCPVHEDIVPRPLSPYGASKLAMEGYLSAFGGAYGFKWTSLRFANVYGPYSLRKESVVALYFRRIMNGEELLVYGDGEQIRDYVYAGDLVEGVVSALEAEAVGVFQLGTGIPTTVNQLLAEMREIVGPLGDFKVRYVDRRGGEIVNTFCDISKAEESFGYSASTSLREGLISTWEWLKQARGESEL
jgi:UDP-glucose 4-epimerase